jgi:hypothetical protein
LDAAVELSQITAIAADEHPPMDVLRRQEYDRKPGTLALAPRQRALVNNNLTNLTDKLPGKLPPMFFVLT